MCKGKVRKAALIFLALISGGTASAATQTIAFDAIRDQILGISPFVVVAQASSGLPVSFASGTPLVCKNAGSLIMPLSAGTCSITASQAGNVNFNAATPVTRSFTVSVAKASGSFTAATGNPFGTGQGPRSVATGDFNGDGVLDLAIANAFDNNVTVLFGNGSGGFTADPSGPFPAGTQPWSLVTGDFNADGHVDIAVASVSSDDVTVLLGNGSGAFTAAAGSPIAIGTLPFSLTIGDFNGDGVQDLVTVNANDNSLTVLLGDGSGGFTAESPRIMVGANPNAAVTGDFNHDNIQDLAVSNLVGQSVTVLLGNGSGGFTQPTGSPFALPHPPSSIVAGDFNGDGVPDLAMEFGATFSVLTGDGTGQFTDAFDSPPVTGNFYAIAAGDFNGDGNQDLIAANPVANEIAVLPGNGHAGFTVATGSPYTTGASPFSIVVADFNGDGVLDVAMANYQGNNVTVLLGFVVGSTSQTIAFGSLSSVTYGVTPIGIAASADSGLAVSFASASPTVCTVAGSTVTVVGGGACSIVASQAGNATYAAAATVTQSFTVNLEPQTITFGPLSNVNLGVAPFTVSATASSGLGVVFSSGTQSVCAVSGNTVTILAVGACSITAIQFGNSTVAYASATQSFSVFLAQTISFAPLPNIPVSTAPFSVSATASSGMSVTFTSNTTAVCTVAGNTVTIVIAGGCSITAAQAGDSTYAAASATQSFTVLFADVSPSDIFYNQINAFAQYGITNGCGSNNFCPAANVTRDEMAIFIVRAIYGSDNFTYTTTPYFTDVTPSTFGFQWIQKLKDLGVTSGCTATTYCPSEVVTRDQMAIFIIRARLGVSIAGPTPTFTYPSTPYFTDSTVDNEFAFPWIQRMKVENITTGCTATTYCPTDPVTREQMATFIMRGAFNQFLPTGTPVISSISPATLPLGTSGTYTITGLNTNFVQGTTQLSAIPGVTIGAITVNNATSMTVQLTAASNAVAQPYSIQAITGSEQDVLPNGVTIQ
jgi:hypothetical protein